MSEENKDSEREKLIERYERFLMGKLDDKNNQQTEQDTKTSVYHGIRFVEVICIGIAVFGMLWKGTEILNLDTPGFMMLYGGAGALISEIVARIFKKKTLK